MLLNAVITTSLDHRVQYNARVIITAAERVCVAHFRIYKISARTFVELRFIAVNFVLSLTYYLYIAGSRKRNIHTQQNRVEPIVLYRQSSSSPRIFPEKNEEMCSTACIRLYASLHNTLSHFSFSLFLSFSLAVCSSTLGSQVVCLIRDRIYTWWISSYLHCSCSCLVILHFFFAIRILFNSLLAIHFVSFNWNSVACTNKRFTYVIMLRALYHLFITYIFKLFLLITTACLYAYIHFFGALSNSYLFIQISLFWLFLHFCCDPQVVAMIFGSVYGIILKIFFFFGIKKNGFAGENANWCSIFLFLWTWMVWNAPIYINLVFLQ